MVLSWFELEIVAGAMRSLGDLGGGFKVRDDMAPERRRARGRKPRECVHSTILPCAWRGPLVVMVMGGRGSGGAASRHTLKPAQRPTRDEVLKHGHFPVPAGLKADGGS